MKHIPHIDMGASKRLSAADMNAIVFQTGRHSRVDTSSDRSSGSVISVKAKGES